MKSFRQKDAEKAIRLEAEKKVAKEKAKRLAYLKERDELLKLEEDQVRKNVQYLHDQALQEESQRLQEIANHNTKKSKPTKITLQSEIRQKELKNRNKQKNMIKDILSGEDKLRDNISSVTRQDEIDKYDQYQLQKIEEAEKLLEQQLAEEKVKQEQERLDEIAEQEKLARWKENEKIEQEEKQRMKELREAQEQEKKAKEAAELQEIISSRKIYELRQQEIAKQQKEKREAVNAILKEAQYILDSQKNTREKQVLSNLHDYIYRLNPNQEKDIWTERAQPKSILTWEEWKQVPANNILIEQDFKRARLLFEQDNQRAQRYHDHMFQNFAGRNLTLDRKKAIAASGKLVDIPHSKAVELRREFVEDIGDIQCWLDAADTGLLHATVTASMATASISAFWVPDDMIGVNTRILNEDETFESGSLVLENPNNLFDGNPNTYASVYHTSASYDWHQRNNNVLAEGGNQGAFLKGTFYLRIVAPENHTNSRIERIELRSTDRNFIPTYVNFWAKDKTLARWHRLQNYDITGSFLGNYNNRLNTGDETTGLGGVHGITPEGSASIDPLLVGGLWPTQLIETEVSDPSGYHVDDLGYRNDVLVRVCTAATGSEVRFNGLDIFYLTPESGSVSAEKPALSEWHSRQGPHINFSASVWRRQGGTDFNSRHTIMESPMWYSSSANQPNGIDMPYVQFRSESFSALTSLHEFHDYTENNGFTHFWVARDTAGLKNQQNIWYGDAGQTYKSALKMGVTGHYKGIYTNLTDWDDGGDQTSANQRHKLEINKKVFVGEQDLYGNYAFHSTGSAWPFVGQDHDRLDQSTAESGILQREVSILCHQLDNPMNEVSASKFRIWHKGGTPFVDLDASPITDYSLTGSYFAPPQIGCQRDSEWGDFRLHEMIIFNKVLTTNEIDIVNDYLSDKWKLISYPVASDVNGQLVYGLSSSNSSMDVLTYDGTDRTNSDTIYSSSAWELS